VAQSILEDLPEQNFTADTIKRMYGLIDRAKTDTAFQKLIYDIVNRAMPGEWKKYKQELSTIFRWYKKNIDYRRDPYGVELLQDVWSTLDRKRGDCDDATTFLASAAEVLGSPARIVTVSTRKSKEPNHVYAEAFVGGRWQGLDATVPGSSVGWVPPQVTARKIWTRSELGISGGEELDGIEGLGMSSNNGYGNENDFGTMTPVSGRLAPGVPDDISKTYGSPRPGVTDISRRKIWRAPTANDSDWTSNPRPGGGVYGPALPIKSMPTPSELWYLVDRNLVPKVLDPDSAWWGKVPTSKEDLKRMFPGSEGTMATYLKDIASVPASAIAEIEGDVKKQLALGEISMGEIGQAIEEGLQGYALGLPPRMKRPPAQRPQRTFGKGVASRVMDAPGQGGKVKTPGARGAKPYRARHYMVQGPVRVVPQLYGGNLNGLGDVLDDAAKALSTGVQSGAVPPSSVNQLINDAVSVITGKPAVAPPAPATSSIAQTAIPIGMIALLGLAAFLMSGGSKKKYRSNPGRRRSSRRGRGGGMDMKNILLWGGGGLAAYFLLLRPGAPLMPAVLKPATPTIPGMTAQEQAALAAGVKAAPSIIDSISKLFGGGSTQAATTTTKATAPTPAPTGQFVTNYDQIGIPTQPSTPDSQFVTSYDDASAA
jgi:hypothetical protein